MARGGRFSDFLVTPWLQQILAQTNFLGLTTQDPFSVGNASTVEIIGQSYARQIPTFTLTGRLLTSGGILTWQGIPPGAVVSHIAGWDAAFNGNLLWGAPIPGGVVSYPNGGYFQIPANQYFVGIDT